MTAASITCTELTVRFPVYGADAKSLKKALARAVAVGGALGRHAGVTDVTALEGVNLKLQAGDRLGLIGHNGSGKTTLLRALSGAYEPDEGSIEVHGRIASLLDLSLGIDPRPPATRTSACAAGSAACRRRTSTRGWTRSRSSPDSAPSSRCR